MTTHVPLERAEVEELEPEEGTDAHGIWISPFAVPRSAEVEADGPGLVRSVRFNFLDEEPPGKKEPVVPLDQRNDPAVDVLYNDSVGRVVAVYCQSPADAPALDRVADRLEARANQEEVMALRFSLLMTARVLKHWADRLAAVKGNGQPGVSGNSEEGKMVVTKMFEQGELVIELVKSYTPDPKSGALTESGRWTAFFHNFLSFALFGLGGKWSGPLVDPKTGKTALFDTKEDAFQAAVAFAKGSGYRETEKIHAN